MATTISGTSTLTQGTTAVQYQGNGNFCNGGRFPRGLLLIQKYADAGVVYISGVTTATSDDPVLPQQQSTKDINGLLIPVEQVTAGFSLIASVAGQKVFAYAL